MKRLLTTLAGTLFSFIVYSQVPFVTYEAVPNDRQQNTYRQQQQPQYQITSGYYYDNFTKAFKRIKIKINSTSTYGQPQVYIRSVYNAQYNMWSDCNNKASKVNIQLDGETISNSFEWKTQVLNIGTIYFNN